MYVIIGIWVCAVVVGVCYGSVANVNCWSGLLLCVVYVDCGHKYVLWVYCRCGLWLWYVLWVCAMDRLWMWVHAVGVHC